MIIPLNYTTLIGAGNGAILDADMRRLLKEHRAVTLDFSRVYVMDAVFADAAFGVLAGDRSNRKFEGGVLIFAGMNSDVCRNLDMALICRAAETSVRHCVVPALDAWGEFYLVGKTESHVTETWRLLKACPSLTAPDLAVKLTISPSAASNRLKWLSDLGLCLRETDPSDGSKQFIYRRIEKEHCHASPDEHP